MGRDHVATHDELCAWSLACRCGAAGKRLGVRRGDIDGSPMGFACAACGGTVDVFDAIRDGWNGEIDRGRRDAGSLATVPAERWQDIVDVIAIGGPASFECA